MTGKVLKTIIAVVTDIFVYLFLIISLFLAVFSFLAKKSADNTVGLFNYEARIVLTNSMESETRTDTNQHEIKSIPVNSMVFIEKIPTDPEERSKWLQELRVGDVLTFNYYYVEPIVITHRITKIYENKTNGYVIELRGDNKGENNVPLIQIIDTSLTETPNFIIGKVEGQSLLLGKTISALTDPVTLVLSIIFPCCMIIIYELYKISRAKFDEKLALKDEQIAFLEDELSKIKNSY